MRKNSMFNKPLKLLGAGSLLFAALLAGQALAAITTGTIIGSRHDLTGVGTGTNTVYTTGTTEVCVFCHTPHGASTSAQLWNRGAPNTASFTLYTNTFGTLDGTAAQPGANSLLCLSCHDGATALDLIINKPGSGGYNASGASAGYTWTGATTSKLNVGAVTNLGTTLADDHPIGMPYCDGVTTAACADKDFYTNTLYLDAAPKPVLTIAAGLTTGWWIDTGANGIGAGITRDKSDLPLYTTLGTTYPKVECATCHEPHNSGNGTFLRIANTASALCVTCHNK